MRPLGDGLDLYPHVLFQLVGRLGIRRRLVVVLATVVEDELSVPGKVFRRLVLVGLQLLLHGAEVHGLLDDVVVVGHIVLVDGVEERPGRLVVLKVIK